MVNFNYGGYIKKYFILPWFLTWQDALDTCLFQGYRLASNFEDQAEIDFILEKTNGNQGKDRV